MTNAVKLNTNKDVKNKPKNKKTTFKSSIIIRTIE